MTVVCTEIGAPGKCVSGKTVHYVYDLDGQLIAETNADGFTMVECEWLWQTPIAVFPQGSMHYVEAYHLKTPRTITDTSNIVRWSWRSERFGSTLANSNPTGRGGFAYNLRFPGQYFDAESGYTTTTTGITIRRRGGMCRATPLGSLVASTRMGTFSATHCPIAIRRGCKFQSLCLRRQYPASPIRLRMQTWRWQKR